MQIDPNYGDYFFLFHPLLGRKSKTMSAHGSARPGTRLGTAFPASALTANKGAIMLRKRATTATAGPFSASAGSPIHTLVV